MELEEKVKQLQQEFCLPKVLIKTTLCGDGINGDLVKAKQRLQEFKQINNRSDPPLKSPMVCNKPLTGMLEGSLFDSPVEVSDNKTGYQFEEQNRNVGVSGDTSFPPQTTVGLNPTPGNQRSIKSFEPSMKDTAFVRELSLQISDCVNNSDQKLGKLSDSATTRTQNAGIATTLATNQKRRAPDPPKPKSKPNVINSNAHKLDQVVDDLDAGKITAQNAEIAKTQKRNAPDPPKPKSKPNVINSNAHKLGEVVDDLDAGKITAQNAEIAKTPKRIAPDPPKPKSKPNVINSNAPKLGEVLDDLNAAKIRTQNAEIAKTPRNAPVPPKCKPKPSWRREPVHGEVYMKQNKAESYGEENQQLNERKVAESSSANMDVQELEEKLKQLQKEFSLPKVLLKKTLCGDDVNGDLVKARERLQEFKQIDNPFVLKITSPMANEPVTENSKRGIKDSSLQQWKPNNNGPEHWVTMPRDERGNDVTVHLVDLEITCSEYQDVAERFRQTVPSHNISSIARIQNPFLYQAYQLRKQKMDKDNEGDNERRLFHGTNPGNITKINTQGFDRSFSGSVNGARYGTGVYFARDASYSRYYTSQIDVGALGTMYLARVLVGQYCEGSSSMRKPPPKNPQQPEILFDSLVNQMNDPSIFVVYYDNQCYPEYLIRF